MRLLVVEDDYKIGNALKRGLEQEAYAVDLERDGDAGLASAETGSYDLLVLDRMLPGGYDGLAIAKAMREAGHKTPILMLTARGATSDRVDGLDAGADDYLVKPFAFEELLARVRALLRRPTDQLDSKLKYADLVIDTSLQTAERAGRELELTRKEYALLCYLARNPERILSKDQIIEHVWDFDADILPNTVEAYIGYLRQKLEQPFKDSPRLIHTKRGFGYILKAKN